MPRRGKPLYILVKLARKIAGLSQEKLATKTGISQPLICNIEKDKRPVTETKMRAIARATRCSFWIRSKGSSLLDKEETKMIEDWLEGELDHRDN